MSDSPEGKEAYAAVMAELMKSERFLNFLANNFTIQKIVDEDEKSIEIRVIERPTSVGVPLTQIQLKDMYNACSSSGVINTRELMIKLLTILGQETKALIVPDSLIKTN